MFGNFFGIVIISASVLMIAGLVLRPTPDLPARMNLGIVDETVDATQQAPSAVADTIEPTTATLNNDISVDTAEPVKTEKPNQATVEAKELTAPGTAPVETPIAPAATGLNKKYLDIKKQAAKKSATAPARTNKSDSGKYADQ